MRRLSSILATRWGTALRAAPTALAIPILSLHSQVAQSDPPAQGYAPVPGGRLYYETRGKGPPLVLIHGGSMDRRLWDLQLEPLASRFRVIRYDVRNFGRSSTAKAPFASADDLGGLLRFLRVDRAYLVGLSLGGRIAIDFALTHPDAVRALILAGPGLSGYQTSTNTPARVAELQRAIEQADSVAVVEWWLRSPYMTAAMERADLVPRIRRLVRDNVRNWFVGSLERPAAPPALGRLHELRVPMLVIVGARDVPDMHRIGDTLAAAVPGATKIVVADAGHIVNLERPGEFNRLVLTFLAKH